MSEPKSLPPHVEDAIEAIAQLHRQHQRDTTPTQRIVNQITRGVSRPRFAGGLAVALAAWLIVNIGLQAAGRASPDPAPFNLLQAATGVASLLITVLILITQRRENELSEARDQLTLELAMLNDQKSAKIIAMIEESRRDNPLMPNRPDEQARQLSERADHGAAMEAIRSTTAEAPSLPDDSPQTETAT